MSHSADFLILELKKVIVEFIDRQSRTQPDITLIRICYVLFSPFGRKLGHKRRLRLLRGDRGDRKKEVRDGVLWSGDFKKWSEILL